MGSNKREMYHSTVSEVETRTKEATADGTWKGGGGGDVTVDVHVIVGIRFTLAHHSLRVVLLYVHKTATN